VSILLFHTHVIRWLIKSINSETKQRTLEELDQVFSVPVNVFAHYQLTKALPYWIKRWIFFRRDAQLEPLYKVELDKKEKATSLHSE
jgi:hypothetical protein